MKNVFILILIFWGAFNIIIGQDDVDSKRDYQWCFGYYNSPPLIGRTVMSFLQMPPSNQYINTPSNMTFDRTNTSISDTSGTLLLYSNYFQILNGNHHLVEGGDSLNCCTGGFGYYPDGIGVVQSAIILPYPNHPDFYVLLSPTINFAPPPHEIFCSRLNYSIIDMDANGGEGKVIAKDVAFINDSIGISSMTACRHANGRDWWMLIRELNSNRFHRILISPQGVFDIGVQSIGDKAIDLAGQTIFSPDGTKYAITGFSSFDTSHVYLYSFNRCTGLLDSPIHKIFRELDPYALYTGACMAPNSNMLYICTSSFLYQIDLQSEDKERILIAEYDGFQDSVIGPSFFNLMSLAPDNKIYISAKDTRYLHIIDNPDSLGVSCDVKQHEYRLSTKNMRGSMPHFPNYRLGPLVGSGCDTLTTGISPPAPFGSAQGTGDLPPALYIYKIETNKGSEYGKLVLE